MGSLKNLKTIFDSLNQRPIAFLIKGSPDPDAIASSLALLSYYQSIGGDGQLYHEDYVSHSANKTMLNVLDIKLQETEFKKLNTDHYAIIDHCNPHIEGLDVSKCILHIDHHKEIHESGEAKVVNQVVEYDSGACSSIVTRLLGEVDYFSSGADNIAQIATALAYGIKTDTDNLDSARPKDYEAMKILAQYLNKDHLQKITRSRIPTQTADVLKKALVTEKSDQGWLYAGVGFLQETYRDSIASVADEMMRRAGTDSVLVYAIIEKSGELVVEGSVRSIDAGFDIDNFVKNFSDNAGGRKYKGGFQIPLGFWSTCPNQEMIEELVRTTIESKLKSILGTNTKKTKGKKEHD
jgi:nanoRNase/pAp phosphatase (c-di-AMP/oligoRNAs hydrolase)